VEYCISEKKVFSNEESVENVLWKLMLLFIIVDLNRC
jgi:hypothetical protein